MWKLAIEESSQELREKGILCLVNDDGKYLFVKVVNHKGDFLELRPLTIAEMKDANIEETQHIINREFDFEVEESQSEPEKKKGFNLNDPNDMKEAERIAQEQLRRIQEKDPSWIKPEQKNTNDEIADEIRQTISDRYVALGHTPPSLQTKEDIESATEILKALQARDKELDKLKSQLGSPSGSAPLNEQQIHGSTEKNRGYDSIDQMVHDIREREKEGDNEAHKIMNELFRKAFSGTKEQRQSPDMNLANPKPERENLNKNLEVPINALTEGESELEKFGVKTQKKRKKSEEQWQVK